MFSPALRRRFAPETCAALGLAAILAVPVALTIRSAQAQTSRVVQNFSGGRRGTQRKSGGGGSSAGSGERGGARIATRIFAQRRSPAGIRAPRDADLHAFRGHLSDSQSRNRQAPSRTQLTFYKEMFAPRIYPPAARRRSDSFIFSKDIGGGEFYQLYRYDHANGAITLLTDGSRATPTNIWSHERKESGVLLDPPQLATTSTSGSASLRIPTIPEQSPRRANAGGGWAVADWSPDDSQLLVTGIYFSERIEPVADERRDRREDVADAERALKRNCLSAPRNLQQGRKGNLRHHRQRV